MLNLKNAANVKVTGKAKQMKTASQAYSQEFLNDIMGQLDTEVKALQAINPKLSDVEALKELTGYDTKASDKAPSRRSYGVSVTVPPFEVFGVPVTVKPIWLSMPIK